MRFINSSSSANGQIRKLYALLLIETSPLPFILPYVTFLVIVQHFCVIELFSLIVMTDRPIQLQYKHADKEWFDFGRRPGQNRLYLVQVLVRGKLTLKVCFCPTSASFARSDGSNGGFGTG